MPLIHITPEKFDIELDIAYATPDNFTGSPLYKNAHCYLHKDAVEKIEIAIKLAAEVGFRIKIFDAFRPLEVQKLLWDKYPDPEFVSNPDTGRIPHCRGIAVDMTLIDDGENALDMGTEFDEFSKKSHHGNTDISQAAQKNRYILVGIMAVSGWDHNPNEWWHYQLPDPFKYEKFTDEEAGTAML